MCFMESNQSIQIDCTEASTSRYLTDVQLVQITVRIKIPSHYFSFLFLLNHCHFSQSNVPTGGAIIGTLKQFWATIFLHFNGKYFCGKKFLWIKTTQESFKFLRNLYLWTQKIMSVAGNHFERHCQNPLFEGTCLPRWSALTDFCVTRI